jgi:hypothetical protein
MLSSDTIFFNIFKPRLVEFIEVEPSAMEGHPCTHTYIHVCRVEQSMYMDTQMTFTRYSVCVSHCI